MNSEIGKTKMFFWIFYFIFFSHSETFGQNGHKRKNVGVQKVRKWKWTKQKCSQNDDDNDVERKILFFVYGCYFSFFVSIFCIALHSRCVFECLEKCVYVR